MNVSIRNKVIAKVSALLMLIATALPSQANAESSDTQLVVANETRSGYATVISKPVLGVGQFIYYPTAGGMKNLSSGFGWRPKACGACSTNHHGSDFTAAYGSKIRSVSGGVVEYIGWEGSNGFVVRIKHPDLGNVATVYAHLLAHSNTVKVGDQIDPNQVIARVGMTGTSTGPHLHLEVWVDGHVTDPVRWLKKHGAVN